MTRHAAASEPPDSTLRTKSTLRVSIVPSKSSSLDTNVISFKDPHARIRAHLESCTGYSVAQAVQCTSDNQHLVSHRILFPEPKIATSRPHRKNITVMMNWLAQ